MHEPKGFISILWSVVWLVVGATIALYFATQLLSQVWWILLILGLFAGTIYVLIVVRRRRSDRW